MAGVVGILALARARTWALAEVMAASEGPQSAAGSRSTWLADDADAGVALSLDLEGHDVCPAGRALLAEVPASDGLRVLGHWWSRVEEHRIIFDQGWSDEKSQDASHKVVHARLIHDPVTLASYVGLYDQSGRLWSERCLVIWDRTDCRIVNPGHAPGRCPDPYVHASRSSPSAVSATARPPNTG